MVGRKITNFHPYQDERTTMCIVTNMIASEKRNDELPDVIQGILFIDGIKQAKDAA